MEDVAEDFVERNEGGLPLPFFSAGRCEMRLTSGGESCSRLVPADTENGRCFFFDRKREILDKQAAAPPVPEIFLLSLEY